MSQYQQFISVIIVFDLPVLIFDIADGFPSIRVRVHAHIEFRTIQIGHKIITRWNIPY
jgi:hypothetical protein